MTSITISASHRSNSGNVSPGTYYYPEGRRFMTAGRATLKSILSSKPEGKSHGGVGNDNRYQHQGVLVD